MSAPASNEPSAGELWATMSDAAAETPAEGAAPEQTETPAAPATSALPAPTEEQSDAEGETGTEDGETPGEAPDGDAPADPAAAKRAQLDALARELGLEIDGRRVLNADWIKVRRAAADAKRDADGIRSAAQVEADQIRGGASAEVEAARALRKAWDARDPDAIAKALGAETWEGVNKELLASLADPNYRRMRELEERDAKREADRKKAEDDAKARDAEQQRAAAHQRYERTLVGEMQKSADSVVSSFADDPLFVRSIISIQSKNWDSATRTTISAEEALDWRSAPGRNTLREDLIALQNRFQRAGLAVATSPEQVPSSEPPGAHRPAPKVESKQAKTASNTRRKAAEAAAPVDPGDGKALIAAFGKRINEENAHKERERRQAKSA